MKAAMKAKFNINNGSFDKSLHLTAYGSSGSLLQISELSGRQNMEKFNESFKILLKNLKLYFKQKDLEAFQDELKKTDEILTKFLFFEHQGSGKVRFFEHVFRTPGSHDFITTLMFYFESRLLWLEKNQEGKFPLSYIIESDDALNLMAFIYFDAQSYYLDTEKHLVTKLIEQYNELTGKSIFDKLFFECTENIFTEHGKEIRRIFNIITRDQEKKIEDISYYINMEQAFALEDTNLKKEILQIYFLFAELRSQPNDKHLTRCKETDILIIKLMNDAHENSSKTFQTGFIQYAAEAKMNEDFNDNCMEFAKLSSEGGNESIFKFLIKQEVIADTTRINMIPLICKNGYHKSLEICIDKFYASLSNLLGLFATFLVKEYHDPQNTLNYDKCMNLISKIEDFQLAFSDPENFEKVSMLIKTAHKLRINHAFFKFLENDYYIGYDDQNLNIVDKIDAEMFEKFLNSRVVLKMDDSQLENITLNYKFLLKPEYRGKDSSCDELIFSETMKPLRNLAEQVNVAHLITHPILDIFIREKYGKYFRINAINFAIFFLSWFLLIYGIFTLNIYLFVVNPSYVMLREIFQLYIKRDNYFQSKVNCIELVIILVAILGVVAKYLSEEAFHVASAFLILLTTSELFFLAVNSNSRLYLHMSMFLRVAKTFSITMIMFSMILVAFSLGFFLVFIVNQEGNDPSLSSSSIYTFHFNNFNDLGLSFIKVLVMLTGEFDSSGIELRNWYQTVFLVGFVFIAVTIFNFINALAIGDVQDLKQNAQFFMLSEKIKNISNNERLCHRLYIKFGSNGYLIKVLKYLINQTPSLHKFLYIRVINPEEAKDDNSLLNVFKGHREGHTSDLVIQSKKTFELLHRFYLKVNQESPKQEKSDHKSFLQNIFETHQAQMKLQIEKVQMQLEDQKKFIEMFLLERSRKRKQIKLRRRKLFKRRLLTDSTISIC